MSFETLHNSAKKNIGGKAFYLNLLKKEGFNVPDFFIISNEVIHQIVLPVKDKVENIVSNIKEGELLKSCDLITELVLSIKITKELETALLLNAQENFGDNYQVAVRSSALDEDGEKTSFAGQHDSFLFVAKKDLIRKIKESIASAWSVKALTYRLLHDVSIKNIQYAIVVQKMIDAESSGIGFSMNVQANMNNMVIVLGKGIGEGIVNDNVVTDTYYINRITKSITRKFNTKKENLSKALVSNKQLIQVSNVLLETEKILNTIVDIEFSFDKNKKLHVLQLRPVTGIDLRKIKILDNTNIVESYPNVSLPLTYSFVKNAYANVFTNAAKAFWLPKGKKQEMSTVFNELLGYYNGSIYYRLDNWYKMMSQLFSSKKSIKSWETAVGLKTDTQTIKSVSYASKFRVFLSIVWLLLNYRKGNKKFFNSFKDNYSYLQLFKDKGMSSKELLEHLNKSSKMIYKDWHITLINDLISFKSFAILQNLITKNSIGNEDLANDLLNGKIKSESEKAVLELLKIKDIIKNNSLFIDLFSKPDKEIERFLNKKPYIDLQQSLNLYIKKYGDRTLSELKLETETLKQNPRKLINLIKNSLDTSINISAYKTNQIKNYELAIHKVKNNLKWYHYKRYFLFFIRNLASYGLRNRENMRFARTRVYGVAKDIYLEIANQMCQENSLKYPNDIFYLKTDELEKFFFKNKKYNFNEIVKRRKEEFERYKLTIHPDRIIYIDKPPIISENNFINCSNKKMFKGVSVSKGIIRAEVIVVKSPDYNIKVKNKIIVTKSTDPGWVFLMAQSAGIITERGSLLSHTAIVGRELGIPVIVGIDAISTILKNGDIVLLDADSGIVKIIDSN